MWPSQSSISSNVRTYVRGVCCLFITKTTRAVQYDRIFFVCPMREWHQLMNAFLCCAVDDYIWQRIKNHQIILYIFFWPSFQSLFIFWIQQNYLMRFGYLPKSNIETGNLRTEDQLIESIKSLQRAANINETGVIDEVTSKLMRTPRCGLPDNINLDFSATNRLSRRRHKRYIIQGSKWSSTSITWR